MMTPITIAPSAPEGDEPAFRAAAGGVESFGRTAGEALDALDDRLGPEAASLVVVHRLLPDRFFGDPDRARLVELSELRRDASGRGGELTEPEAREYEALVEAELRASAARASALADAMGR